MKIPKAPSWGVVFLLATTYQLILGKGIDFIAPLICLICWVGKQWIDRYLEKHYNIPRP